MFVFIVTVILNANDWSFARAHNISYQNHDEQSTHSKAVNRYEVVGNFKRSITNYTYL